MNATGNGNDTYQITFANEVGQAWFDIDGNIVFPLPGNSMTIPLKSQLPTIPINRTYTIVGEPNQAVTITRSSDESVTENFRFLDVAAGGSLTVNGLKLTGADNRVNGGFGGAIRNATGGTLGVVNCEFRSHLAELGGAIGNEGTMTVSGGAAGMRTLFVSNRSMSQGGAINTGAVNGCSATISDTNFVGNIAGDAVPGVGTQKGGAISYKTAGTLVIDRCEFTGNRAKDGGALYASMPAAVGGAPTVVVSDSTFDSNVAESGGNGGAAFMSTVGGRFNRCDFTNNIADLDGGAILQDQGALTLDTNTFGVNTAKGANLAHQVANRLNPGPAPITQIGVNSGLTITWV